MRGFTYLISQSTQFPSGAKVGKRKICKGIFGRSRGNPQKKKRQGRSAWERETERRREETNFGCKGCSQNAAFQVRIFYFLLFPPLLPCPRRTTRARQAKIAVSVHLMDWDSNTHIHNTQDHFLMAASWPSFLKIKLSFVWFLKLDLFIECCCVGLGYCDGN